MGDTAAATLSCAVAVGASFADAARLANISAGLVVAKPDTSTVTDNELMTQLCASVAARYINTTLYLYLYLTCLSMSTTNVVWVKLLVLRMEYSIWSILGMSLYFVLLVNVVTV